MANDDNSFVLSVSLDFSTATKQLREWEKKHNKYTMPSARTGAAVATNGPAFSVGSEFTKMAQAVRVSAGLFKRMNDSMRQLIGTMNGASRANGNAAISAAGAISRRAAAPGGMGKATEFAMALPGAAMIAGVAARPLMAGLAEYGNREKLRTDLGTLLQDDNAGAEMAGRIQRYAASTPYSQGDLSGTAKMLIQYGASMDEAEKTLKQLGDIAMGSGQALSSLGLVMGQVRSAGKMQGQDLMQFINAGFNPLSIISEQTGKSMAQLKDEMAKGAITFEMVAQAMEDATSEGGKFYKGAERGAKTLQGLWSTIQDNLATALADMIANNEGAIKQMATEWANFDFSKLAKAGGDLVRFIMKFMQAASAMAQTMLDHAELIKAAIAGIVALGAAAAISKTTASLRGLKDEIATANGGMSGLRGTIAGIGKTALGTNIAMAGIVWGLEQIVRFGSTAWDLVKQWGMEDDQAQAQKQNEWNQSRLKAAWDEYKDAKKQYGGVDNQFAQQALGTAYNKFLSAAQTVRDANGFGLTQAMKEELGWAEKTNPKKVTETEKNGAKGASVYAPTYIQQENRISVDPSEMGNIVREYLSELLTSQMNFTIKGAEVRGLA